jgi:hypothetical protein
MRQGKNGIDPAEESIPGLETNDGIRTFFRQVVVFVNV